MFPQILIFFAFFPYTFCEKCVCVPFWKCNDEDVASSEDFNSSCEGYFDVCCKIRCGQRKTDNLQLNEMIRNRILGNGNEANFAEFPWMLGLLYGNSYKCGASLIHPQVALTAAHCVQKNGPYKVRAGEWDWRSRKEPLKHQDRTVKKIIVHPWYNSHSLANDVALLITDRQFQITDNVGLVCLPPQNSFPVPEECVVTGWGKTSHKGKQQNVLNKATFPIVPNFQCQLTLQNAHLGGNFRLHPSFICAGGANRDTCKGDGGSPLMCTIEGEEERYEQFGIVSWGLVCGIKDTPGVYVNVARFIDWIDKQMALHGFDSEVYKI